MIDGDGEEGYLNGERVQEGVSEPFQVRDWRTEASEKTKQLKLTHSMKCIKKIGKNRASLLQKKNINTVEDFKFFYIDEVALREILCIKSKSGKEWVSMVEHVTQCADEFHAKYNASNNSSQPNPYENKIIEAKFRQLCPTCDSSSMNVSNEHISTASVVRVVETQRALFLETNMLNHLTITIRKFHREVAVTVMVMDGFQGLSLEETQLPGGTFLGDSLPPSCQARSVMFAFYYNSG